MIDYWLKDLYVCLLKRNALVVKTIITTNQGPKSYEIYICFKQNGPISDFKQNYEVSPPKSVYKTFVLNSDTIACTGINYEYIGV